MNNARTTYLHERYLQNSLTQSELEEWKALLDDIGAETSIKKLMDANWKQLQVIEVTPLPPERSQAIISSVLSMSKEKIINRLWPRIAITAAVAAIIVSAGIWLIKQNAHYPMAERISVVDVAPGKQTATLTLANGKKIRLTDALIGELAIEAGVTISKSSDGQLIYEITKSDTDLNKFNTLSTTNGETYRVKLPDGSVVWLNAGSSLTYRTNLIENGKRKTKLTGEGYFEIARDKKHPFIVETSGQQVEVLGTHFNINAYQKQAQVRTTLAEGSIKVTASGKSFILKPNQQAALKNGELTVIEVDAAFDLAWKEGFFLFNREPLESIMIKVAQWYDIEVSFNDESLRKETFLGTISRFEKISAVLAMLEETGDVKFTIEGKKVIIDRKKKS